jgi:hypothetical protein
MYPSYMLNAVAGNNGMNGGNLNSLPATGIPYIDAFSGKFGNTPNMHSGIPFLDALGANGGQGFIGGLSQWLSALGMPSGGGFGSGSTNNYGANAWNIANTPASAPEPQGMKIGDGMMFPTRTRNYAVSSVPTSGQTQLNTGANPTPGFGSPSEGLATN